VRFFVVPHTHWDREWYRPFEHFRLALGRVVDELIDVLERDDAFTSFTLDGQAVVLEDYVEVRPENEGRLRALLAAGRIEVGPSYVLPDEFLVGGEALVRNLLIGRATCRRFGAEPSAVGYMPDSFGHPLQLPQILSGFGLHSFIFSRGLGDQLDEIGVVFRWRAPDGSSVLAFQQLPDYSNFAEMSEPAPAEERIRSILEQFGTALDAAGIDCVLLCNGSDHLPVVSELPRLCSQLEERMPGSSCTISRYVDYVRAVGTVQVPAFEGELLGSRLQNVLRGVNSARLYIKQANERAEQRLLAVETLSALSTLCDGAPFSGPDFQLAWRELLRCHPHDTICGCSCDEVHRDSLTRYESLHRTLSMLQDRALSALSRSDATSGIGFGVANLLPQRRGGLVEVPGFEPALVELDGWSAQTVELTAAASPRSRFGGSAIENELLRVEAGGDGTLVVIDKERDRRYEGLHALEDELDMGDLYNFCPPPEAQAWHVGEHASARVLRAGPTVSELEVRVEAERPAGLDDEFRPLAATASVVVTTVVRLLRGSDRIEFRTVVENGARDHRLRVSFPVVDGIGPVRAEGQFALVRRAAGGLRARTEWAEPPDPTDHTLGAVALGPLALLTRGLPEYEARGGDLCLTLLRCVGVIAQPGGVLSTRPRHAGPRVPTPEGQCLGRYELEYALLPRADLLDDVSLLQESQDYRNPFLVVREAISFEAPITLEGDIVFSCLKGAEDGDGLILRCFNPSASPALAHIAGTVAVSEVGLDETGDRPVGDGLLQLRGGQIGTLRLRPV
jgi:alpha-mannosidase